MGKKGEGEKKGRVKEKKKKEKEKKKVLRAGFEPATYGFLCISNHYSPPLYQLSYRRLHDKIGAKVEYL